MRSLILLALIPVGSFFSQEESNKTLQSLEEEGSVIDTIIERNDPAKLDMNFSQLFIDTTKNSDYFKKYINWQPSQEMNESAEYYLSDLKTEFNATNSEMANFETEWVSLKKYKDEFLIYNRCDGNIKFFGFKAGGFITYGPIESEVDLIFSAKQSGDSIVEFILKTIPEKTEDRTATLKLEKTSHPDVYVMTYQIGDFINKEYVAPKNKLTAFNMLINHCTQENNQEFEGFDDFAQNK